MTYTDKQLLAAAHKRRIWKREYMREYMRKYRAEQALKAEQLEQERLNVPMSAPNETM